MFAALTPAVAKARGWLAVARSKAVAAWAKPWVRKVAALILGSLLAGSCELWPSWSRLVCTRLAPMIEVLLAGAA